MSSLETARLDNLEVVQNTAGFFESTRIKKLILMAGSLAVAAASTIGKPDTAAARTSLFNESIQSQPTGPASPDFADYFPDFTMVREGNHLEGFNSALPNFDPNDPFVSARTVLVFEAAGSAFTMSSVAPEDPHAGCQYDQYDWQDLLRYTETYSGCGSTIVDTLFQPGIGFMPRSLDVAANLDWQASGQSQSTIYKNHEEVCTGKNYWLSSYIGSAALDDGGWGYHFRTDEKQVYKHIDGAPPYSACLPGPPKVTFWEENFYLSDKIPIISPLGEITGYAPGIIKSNGGNRLTPKHKATGTAGIYNSLFSGGWQKTVSKP